MQQFQRPANWQHGRSALVVDERWQRAALPAFMISAVLLALFWAWFGMADRYRLFLYYHDMGGPDTAPFSRVTSSRYWMAGLVASGGIFLVYTGLNWLLGRRDRDIRPPAWFRVWLLCVPGLLAGITLIASRANQPVLPLGLGLLVAGITLSGLALALWAGTVAARQPGLLLWLLGDGVGLAFVLVVAAQLDDLATWAAVGRRAPLILAVLTAGAGLSTLLLLSLRFLWPSVQVPTAVQLFLSGCVWAYLLLPLAHHLLFTDGYYYITDSDNFLAATAAGQGVAWALAGLLAWLITRGRIWLQKKTGLR